MAGGTTTALFVFVLPRPLVAAQLTAGERHLTTVRSITNGLHDQECGDFYRNVKS